MAKFRKGARVTISLITDHYVSGGMSAGGQWTGPVVRENRTEVISGTVVKHTAADYVYVTLDTLPAFGSRNVVLMLPEQAGEIALIEEAR